MTQLNTRTIGRYPISDLYPRLSKRSWLTNWNYTFALITMMMNYIQHIERSIVRRLPWVLKEWSFSGWSLIFIAAHKLSPLWVKCLFSQNSYSDYPKDWFWIHCYLICICSAWVALLGSMAYPCTATQMTHSCIFHSNTDLSRISKGVKCLMLYWWYHDLDVEK